MKKIFLAMAFLGVSSLAWGQASSGTITGNVLDPAEAAVPEAEITVTHLATNVSTTVPSTAAGVYRILGLRPGEYRVEATVSGFKTFRQEPVSIFTGTTTTVDIQMEVGAVTETVEVLAQATPLNLVSSEMSGEIEERSLFDLPLKVSGQRRDMESFILLVPGVTGTAFQKNINGSQHFSTETIIDGISWQIAHRPGIVGPFGPPYESLQEFKVQTSNFPAEFSRGMGVTNFTMKSGTNQFHGNVFDFLRNDKLDANQFFRNAAGLGKVITRQNEFGASVGGPIIKDKTFFFFAYTGYKLRGGSAAQDILSLPTVAMKQGDFSEWLDTSKTGLTFPRVIYDPASTCGRFGNPACALDGTGAEIITRQPFPGNIIPTARLDQVASRVASVMPDPEFSGKLSSNFVSKAAAPGNDYDWSIKIDHNFTANHKLAYSMWVREFEEDSTVWFKGPLDNGLLNTKAGRGVRLNYDFFITPTLVHHMGIGYAYRKEDSLPPERENPVNNENFFEIPNFTTGPEGASPSFRIPEFPGFGGRFDSQKVRAHQYVFVDVVTWIKGRHTFKGGVDFRWYQKNENTCRSCAGFLGFDQRATSQPSDANFGGLGHEFASFMLGQVSVMEQDRSEVGRGFRTGYYGSFFQDEVKLTPKLTMNIGFRIEIPVPTAEQYDRLSSLDLNLPNPGAGGRPGAMVFAGFGPGKINSRRFTKIPKDFAPRIGFAYRLNDKTVIRTGFGILYAMTNGNAIGAMSNNALAAGYLFEYFLQTTDNGITPAFKLDVGPPPVNINLPNFDPTVSNGSRAHYLNADSFKTAYTNAWNFSVQREFPSGILVDVAYVGNKGVNFGAGMENLGQVPFEHLSNGPLLLADINFPGVVAAGFTPPFPGFTGTLAQALRPFPQYTSISNWAEATGSNSYNSFQVKVQKRFSAGLSFLVSYTASKTLTNSFRNAYAINGPDPVFTEDRGSYWAVAEADRPQVLAVSGVYELPFGPGKRFANTGGALGKLVGGWQVAGIARYLSGQPVEVQGGPALPIFGGFQTPNLVKGVPVRTAASHRGDFDPFRDKFLDRNAFVDPPSLAVCAPNPRTCRGNLAPWLSYARNFGHLSEDLSIFKFIPFTESIKLEFRAEFYNAFNRTIFAFGWPENNTNRGTEFGSVGGTQIPPREIQFGLKLHF